MTPHEAARAILALNLSDVQLDTLVACYVVAREDPYENAWERDFGPLLGISPLAAHRRVLGMFRTVPALGYCGDVQGTGVSLPSTITEALEVIHHASL